jgi:hypothetical protein
VPLTFYNVSGRLLTDSRFAAGVSSGVVSAVFLGAAVTTAWAAIEIPLAIPIGALALSVMAALAAGYLLLNAKPSIDAASIKAAYAFFPSAVAMRYGTEWTVIHWERVATYLPAARDWPTARLLLHDGTEVLLTGLTFRGSQAAHREFAARTSSGAVPVEAVKRANFAFRIGAAVMVTIGVIFALTGENYIVMPFNVSLRVFGLAVAGAGLFALALHWSGFDFGDR